jgi:cell division protein FtsI (penicillin-binding protein 3)
VYLAFGLVLLFAAAVVFQLYRVQVIQGRKWRSMADSVAARYVSVEAARGNIFSNDGSLLATSVPQYDLHMDLLAGGIADDKVFYEKVDSLAEKLSQYFGDKSAKQYIHLLRDARKDSSRYLLLRRRVSYQELKQIRKFPIFNMGKFKGGLIPVEENKRVLPFKALAARTIGYKNENVKNAVGLEGAYAGYINGENGKRLMQRLPGGIWMPVNEDDEIPAKDGADIISTINVNFQDVAQTALKKQMIESEAEHGCVVLMEVATGQIKAIANYSRTPSGDYREDYNYAISDAAEPGSTFKLATYMTALDQHKIDTNTLVDAEGGRIKLINNTYTVTDAERGNGVMTAKRAFEESSNVAAVKLIYAHYKDVPGQFTSKLYSYHLNEKLGLQIHGEGRPLIKNPKSKDWSKLSLTQMAYGYEMKLTPLQMLTFYNAVANNGKMIAPLFVSDIRRMGVTVEHFDARVINPKVCSDATLGKVRSMLEGVVLEGTGKNVIKNSVYTVAGKTGTAQVADRNKGYGEKKNYQASFCGYFPAEHPKYSMIVVIYKPTKGNYLAAKVAGPVFRAIADRVYSSDFEIKHAAPQHFVGNTQMPQIKDGNQKAVQHVYGKLGVKPLYASVNGAANGVDTSNGVPFEAISYKKGTVPSVAGMGLSDALYVLGNAGYKVNIKGSGAVVKQSVTAGSNYPKGSKIAIELQ